MTFSGARRRLLVPLYAHTLLIQAVVFVLRPTAVYRAIELDVSGAWLGVVGASFALVPLFLALSIGHAADRFGERRIIALGSGAIVLSAGGFVALSDSVWSVLGWSVLLGTGHLGAVVGQQALVANDTPRPQYDKAFGHYTFVASAGQAVGPVLILLPGASETIPDTLAVFKFALVLSVLLFVPTFFLPVDRRAPGATARPPGSVRELLHRRDLIRALTVSCVVLAAVDISLVYLPALGAEHGIAAGSIGVLLALRAAASMGSRFFLGRLVELLGRSRLLTGSIALAAVGMALIAVQLPLVVMAVVIIVMGLGLGAGQPLTMSWLAEETPQGLRGRAMSLRLTGNRLGQVIVPSAAGVVAATAGAPAVLWATALSLGAVGLASRSMGQGPSKTQ
jgi:MFS family permease